MPTKDDVLTVLPAWIDACQALLDSYMKKNFPTLPPEKIVVAGGNKYLKIQKHSVGGSEIKPEVRWTAYAFIDVETGDILKPATWKKPAKHARGNLFDPSRGLACMGPYGPNYIGQSPYCREQC